MPPVAARMLSADDSRPLRVLILGGTTEGRSLASACAGLAGIEVISSLAGRTTSPLLPPGEVRIGGFGGVAGLVAYLREHATDVIVDATHPFAATITANAVAASGEAGVPLLVLRRPGWVEQPGDLWHRVPSLAAAADRLPKLGERVFLTTGRQSIAAFAGVDGCWFLSRSVEPPAPPMPRRLEVLLDRGPFTVDHEMDLLSRHQIEVLVTKDSGGASAKLTAARRLEIPVIVIDRPPLPESAPKPDGPALSGSRVAVVQSVDDAVAWLRRGSAGAYKPG